MVSDEGHPEAREPLAESPAASASQSSLPAIDLSTFVLSLSTTALYQMGLVPDPRTGARTEPDLIIAQQTIETLEMLREKTRGNLDSEEQKLFDSLLYEIRLRYVELDK